MLLFLTIGLAAEPPVSAAPPLALPPPQPPLVIHGNTRNGFTGFRLQVPAGPALAGARLALVADLDGPLIAELTLRGQASWTWFGVAVETAGVGGLSDIWSSASLGNTRVEAAALFGPPHVTHALGVQVTLPTGLVGGADYWGTVESATIGTFGLALVMNGTAGRWGWHIRAGLYDSWSLALVDGAVTVATAQPFGEGLWIVGEVEVVWAQNPVHVRALLRHDVGDGWRVDGGIALPFPGMATDPSIQALGQIYRTF